MLVQLNMQLSTGTLLRLHVQPIAAASALHVIGKRTWHNNTYSSQLTFHPHSQNHFHLSRTQLQSPQSDSRNDWNSNAHLHVVHHGQVPTKCQLMQCLPSRHRSCASRKASLATFGTVPPQPGTESTCRTCN